MGTSRRRRGAASRAGILIERAPWWRDDAEAALAVAAAEANRLIAGDLADELGQLSVAPRRDPDDAFNGLCIRSEPLPAFGGAEFRFDTGMSPPFVPPTLPVVGIRSAALRFVGSREHVESIAAAARALVDGIIASSLDLEPRARLVAISVLPTIQCDAFNTVVTMESLGDGLTLGPDTILVSSPNIAMLRQEVEQLLADHARRALLLASHRTGRTRGLIDQTAKRVMAAAGLDIPFALAQLDRVKNFQFRFDDGRMLGSLEWRDDVLTGEVHEPDNGAYVWEASFTFAGKLPAIISTALVGRALSTLVDRPYLPVDAIITAVEDWGDGGTRVDLTIPTEPLPDPAVDP